MYVGESVEPYQDANDYSIQLDRWLLKPTGAWPSLASTTVRERVISTILIIICSSLIAYTMIPCILNIMFEETDMQKNIIAIGPVSHWIIGGMNYFFLLSRSRDIRHCLQHMKTDWWAVTDSEDRQVMLRYAKVGRFVAGICAIFMHGGVFSYGLLTGTTPTIEYIGNVSVSMYMLPCTTYTKFVDTRQSPAFEITLLLQLISSIFVTSIRVGGCGLAAAFAMHACGQLNMLMRWLDQLDDRKQQDTVERRLAIIVEHHLRVLR